LNSQNAGQNANSTTQTSTSSSTSTTIKPGQSPTNTTTLITSRYLTTTSTRATTTTTTTTILLTTTASINPCDIIDLRLVSDPTKYDGAIILVETPMVWKFCNYGTAKAQLCHLVVEVDGITEYSFGDKLPWLVRPGSCVLIEWIFNPLLYPAGTYVISFKWNYCDSQGNRCNEKPFIYSIRVAVEPI